MEVGDVRLSKGLPEGGLSPGTLDKALVGGILEHSLDVAMPHGLDTHLVHCILPPSPSATKRGRLAGVSAKEAAYVQILPLPSLSCVTLGRAATFFGFLFPHL